MKTFRIWFVILLALLLPLRGALAAGMPCASAGNHHGTQAGKTGVHPHAHAHGDVQHPAHAESGHAGHDHHHDETASSQVEGHGSDPGATTGLAAGADSCSLCAGCCSASAIVSSFLRLPPPQAFNPVPLPSFAAAAPSFIPDGLERPPRSI